MGLFGLSSFIVERRYKEIGIRKVYGASVSQITRMIVIDFIKLISIAIILAFPLSYYVSNMWLDNFAYRIKLSWEQFLVAGVIVIAVALSTVSFQVVKAAGKNPVDSLKYE